VNGERSGGAPKISFVSNRDKELVWKAVTVVFTFDTNDEELKVRIYDWTIKKMAVLFQNWKKSSYNKFVKKNETASFNLKQYVKLLMQKLICKHKGLIPDSNVKACQPI